MKLTHSIEASISKVMATVNDNIQNSSNISDGVNIKTNVLIESPLTDMILVATWTNIKDEIRYKLLYEKRYA